ncbi:hypothetical protein D9M69_644880 [compost metagenome]
MAPRPIEAQRSAPIDAHQHYVVQAQRVDPGLQIACVIVICIGDVRFARATHADQVRREAAAQPAQAWQDLAPQVRRRRVAMQKHEGGAGASRRAASDGAGVFVIQG